MHPLIVFSGGMDSTLVLYNALKQGSADVLYVNAGQSERKAIAEQKAIDRLIPKIERMAGKHRILQRYVKTVASLGGSPQLFFAQPPAWLYAALMVVDSTIHNRVELGYLMTDQIMTMREDLYRAWEAMFRLSHVPPHVPIDLPLFYHTKGRVMRELPWELQKLTWTCEDPIEPRKSRIRPCGKCLPCITLAGEQYKFNLTCGMTPEDFHRTDPLVA